MDKQILISEIALFVFDFDGVLTDNMVYLDQSGNELVMCSRSDGLAFDFFHKLNKDVCILSTETNPVVLARAKKLKVPVLQGVRDKDSSLKKLIQDKGIKFSQVCYVGNDMNDYMAMKLCGIKVCPADSHQIIKDLADVVLSCNGGHGVARELLEEVFQVNMFEVLYGKG